MAKNEAELLTAIQDLEEALDTGATSVNVDGTSVTMSPKDQRKRLKELRKELKVLEGDDTPSTFKNVSLNHSGNL